MIFRFTEAEKAEIQSIDYRITARLNELTLILEKSKPGSAEHTAAQEEAIRLDNEHGEKIESLVAYFDEQRFKKLKTEAAIVKDAKQQIEDAITYTYRGLVEAFKVQDEIRGYKQINSPLAAPLPEDFKADAEAMKKAGLNPVESGFLLDATQLVVYIRRSVIWRHLQALKKNKTALKEVLDYIIDAVENSPYTTQKVEIDKADRLETNAIYKSLMPMYHGKATDALARLNVREDSRDIIADRAVIEDRDITVIINDISKTKGDLSVSTHKLLSTAVAEFARLNNYSKHGGGKLEHKVYIPLKDYLIARGYDIEEHETDTPEEAEKEKKRAVNMLKFQRKRIREDLDILYSISIKWSERIKGADKDFMEKRILQGKGIKNGYIYIDFASDFAEYIASLPMTQYPKQLLSVDDRNKHAYLIGLKLVEHYNMDNNQIKGTADRIKVSNLLSVTNIPIEDILEKDRRHWERRIKEPFEAALDALTEKVINNWEYIKAQNEDLTEQEAYNITDFNDFKELFIRFELTETADHSERLQRRADDKKKAQEKAAAKRRSGALKRSKTE